MKNMKYLLTISKIGLYFILILFISSYFEISSCDPGSKILVNNMPISIICSLIIVFLIERAMPKKAD